ncbi:MAG: hypothetical protein ACTSWN_07600 [Promethearchaeota archaeon]
MKLHDDNKISLDWEDMNAFGNIIVDKFKALNRTFDNALFFPVSFSAWWVLNALSHSVKNEVIKESTWTPAKKQLSARGEIKKLIFVSGIVNKDDDGMQNTLKMFNLLLKKDKKIKRQLKQAEKFVISCFTRTKEKYIFGKIQIISAFYTPNMDNISFLTFKDGKQVMLSEIEEKLGWERNYEYLEKYEVILDKLKTELWD